MTIFVDSFGGSHVPQVIRDFIRVVLLLSHIPVDAVGILSLFLACMNCRSRVLASKQRQHRVSFYM